MSFRFTTGLIWFNIWKGCPQGSCLGPLLWILVANEIIKAFRRLFPFIVSYADDFVVLSGADSRRSLELDVSEKLNHFHSLTQRFSLHVNAAKCQSMLFGLYTLEKRRPIFKMGQESIKVTDTISFLGFTLDARFNWLEHLNNIRFNLHDLTSRMKRVNIRDVGVSASILKIWYLTIIEKKISYGYEVWLPDIKSAASSRLSSCQRLGLQSVIRCYRSVSTEALCVLAGVPPLLLKLTSLYAAFNTLKGDGSTTINNTNYVKSDFETKLPSFRSPHLSQIKNIHFSQPSSQDSDTMIHAYTDGSKMPEGVASAFTINLQEQFIEDFSYKLRPFNTVFQAELVAILQAVRWCVDSEHNLFVIHTDSASSIQSLQRLSPRTELVHDILEKINSAMHKSFYFKWVKAHIGIAGNERADTLAKNAIVNNTYSSTIENIPAPQSYIKQYYKSKLIQDWQTQWSFSNTGRHTYLIINKVNTEYICNYRITAYFITGHGSFPAFLHRLGKRRTDKCPCMRKGDAFHYLFEKCTIIDNNFTYNLSLTPEANMKKILIDTIDYPKLSAIYNTLNEHFSFIKYKF